MKKVRWGVIGAGGIAQRRTIPGMMQCENAELVAVMEITPELAENCRAKWNCKKAYTSAEELLNDPEIDAVYIASPVFLHAQQAMAAADAGNGRTAVLLCRHGSDTGAFGGTGTHRHHQPVH